MWTGVPMRAVLQRVSHAQIVVVGAPIARISNGILALIGISREDTPEDLQWMARKIVELRIFDDREGKLNLCLQEVDGELLLVSQFTLYGDCRKGRRPSFSNAAPPEKAQALYDQFVSMVRQLIPGTQTGQFQATMEVTLTNSGPVTLILDSRQRSAPSY